MAAQQLSPAQWSETHQPTIYGVCSMFIIITNAAVLTRFLSQRRTANHYYIDDWSILIAVILSNLIAAVYLWAASRYGLGLHFQRVLKERGPPAVVGIWQCLWVSAWIQGPLLLAVKVSLLYMYKRIFIVNQRWLKWAWWFCLALAVAWSIAATIYYICQCTPPSYYWNQMWHKVGATPPHPVSGSCVNGGAWQVGMPFVVNLISDLCILALPLITLFRLRMPLKRRLGLAAVFGFGAGAVACEAVRIWMEDTISEKLKDPTYGSVALAMVNLAEPNIAILAACLPAIAAQWRWTHEQVRSAMSSSNGSISTVKSIARKASLASIRRKPASSPEHSRPPLPTASEKPYAFIGTASGNTSTPDAVLHSGRIGVTREVDIESGPVQETAQR